MSAADFWRPLRIADFRRLWLASTLSSFGSSFTQLALPLYVIAQAGSYAIAGVIATIRLVGSLVMQVPGGFMADRFERKLLLLFADGARSICLFVVFALVNLHPAHEFVLLGLVFAMEGLVTSAVNPAEVSAVSSLLPDDSVQSGMATWQAQHALVGLLAPLAGGALFTVSPVAPFLLDAISYVLSFAFIAAICGGMGGGSLDSAFSWRSTLEGLRYVRESQFLRVYTSVYALVNVASSGMMFGMILVLSRSGGVDVGAAMAAVAAGGLLGSILSASVTTTRYQLLISIAAISYAAVGIISGLWTTPLVVAGAVGVGALVSGPTGVPLSGHILRTVPEALLGRVQGGIYLIGGSLYPFAAAITGAVAYRHSVSPAFWMWGFVCLVPVVFFASPKWRVVGGK